MQHYTNSNWLFSDSFTANWYSDTFDASSWTTARPGSFTEIAKAGVSRFYRATVTLPSSYTGIASYEVGIYTKYGYVIYVNGVEIMRNNLAAYTSVHFIISSDATDKTPCIAVSETSSYRRVSLPLDTLPTGTSVVIAAEIHFDEEHEAISDEFKGFMVMIAAGSVRNFGGSFDSDHPSDITTEGMERAFDNDRRTKWYASFVPAYNTIIFDSDRRDFINAYSISSASGPADRRPTKWTLSGSNDGTTWTILDKRDGVRFSDMNQPMKFALPHNHVSYNRMRVSFDTVEIGEALDVGMIQFYADAVSYVATPALTYEKPSVEMFVNQDRVFLSPLNGGFHTFSITPTTLPQGLSFSTFSGTIYGIPAASTDSSTYSISAKHISTEETSYSFSISLSVISCGGTKIRFDVIKKDTAMGTSNKWVLKTGETVIASHIGRDIFGSQVAGIETFKFCEVPGTFSLTLTDQYNRGWESSAYIDVNVYLDDVDTLKVLHYNLLRGEPEAIVNFNTALLSSNDMSTWKYKADGTVPTGWNTVAFTETWDNLPLIRPEVSHSVWLFRKQINVANTINFHGFEMRIFSRAGVVVYLNGAEIYRANVIGDVSGSTTSSVTSTTSIWRLFTERVGVGHLIMGDNTIAIAVVNSNANAVTIDTKINIRLLAKFDISRGINTNVVDNGHAGDSSISANLFHGEYDKRFKASWSSSNQVTATFTNQGKEIINTYCIVGPWNALENSPASWTVATSVDGTTFLDVNTQSNIRMDRIYQRQCYFIPGVTQPISSIRFTFTALQDISSNLQIDAIDLYYIDTSYLSLPAFAYDVEAINAYKDADIKKAIPNAIFYYDYSASADLPVGMVLESSGVIRGRPTAAFVQTAIIINAKSYLGTAVSVSLSIQVSECSDTKSLVGFTTKYVDTIGERMTILLTISDNTKIYYNTDIPNYSMIIDLSFCLNKDVYTFMLLDATNEGWSREYEIKLNSVKEVGGWVSANSSPLTVTVSTIEFISEGKQSFRYNDLPGEVTGDWYKPNYVNTWKQAMPGSFPKTTGYSSYYCTEFEIVNMDAFASYELGIKLKGGFIAYMNGEEINRVRLPKEVTPTTPATDASTTDLFVIYGGTIQVSNLILGTNLLCVDVHKKVINQVETNSFDVYMRPLAAGRDIFVDGVPTASQIGYKDDWYDERYINAFDKSSTTKWFAKGSCSDEWLVWTFNNDRREMGTHISFWKGNGATRNPTTMSVYGTNNENDGWDLINTFNNIKFFTSQYGEHREFDILPKKAYNKYKFSYAGCISEGIEVGEIYIYSTRVSNFCAPSNGIAAAMNNTMVTGPCPDMFVGEVTYKCINDEFERLQDNCVVAPPTVLSYPETSYTFVTKKAIIPIVPIFNGLRVTFQSLPKMPAGMTLDATTGVISGKPEIEVSTTNFVIQCKNDGGNTKANITITVVKAKTPIWLIIIIAVVLIAVIVGIVLAIVFGIKKNKKKAAMKKPSSKKTLPKTVVPKLKDAGSKKIEV